MKTGLVIDRRYRAHVAPGDHPERPERLSAIEQALVEARLVERCVAVAARPATRAELERAHAPEYLDSLSQQLSGDEAGWLDPDTYFSAGSWEAALLAAGASIDLALAVADGALDDGAAFVRPPGHHATRERAMGFCLINNVAVAAQAVRARGARVAIVDWDVHHGNGTEAIFWDDPDVLYCSTHQYPFYPGTGAVSDVGGARARGATVNVPMPAGAGDAAFAAAFDEVILPALSRFGADLVFVSAGFDAHAADPLASMRMTEAGYAHLTRVLLDASRGKLVALLEGGYDLAALGRSAAAMVAALLGDPVAPVEKSPLAVAERHAIAAARAQLGPR